MTTKVENHELKNYTGLIARLMSAIETPDDLTQDEINWLLEDAHIVLKEVEDEKTLGI